jgi:hypothetical protein
MSHYFVFRSAERLAMSMLFVFAAEHRVNVGALQCRERAFYLDGRSVCQLRSELVASPTRP